MKRIKTLTAKNPSEARGIRKALKAMRVKFTSRKVKSRQANPKRKRRTKGNSRGQRRSRR